MATGQCSAILENTMERRQDNALQFWKRLWIGNRTMLCNIGKYNGKATDNALQFWKRLWQGNRAILCNVGKYNGKATGQCSAILENKMARQQDNALAWSFGNG